MVRRLLVLFPLVFFGCRGTGQVRIARPEQRLEVIDSLRLAVSAVDICGEGDRLVVLESSGIRLLRFDIGMARCETIPLTRRLAAPHGLASDRFYFYVYDDHVLYRMLKDELELKSWLVNVRVAGLVNYSPGEMLVSDGERGVVWYKTIFGESRKFLDISSVSGPGPLVALPAGMFCVLTSSGRLVYFNRAGIVVRTVQLKEKYDLIATDGSGGLYLAKRGQTRLLIMKQEQLIEASFGQDVSLMAMAVLRSRIAILDKGNRIIIYRLP